LSACDWIDTDPAAGIRAAGNVLMRQYRPLLRPIFRAGPLDDVVIHNLIERVRCQFGLGSAFGMWYSRSHYDCVSAVQLVPIQRLHPEAMLTGPFHQGGVGTLYRLCIRPNRQKTECEETDESLNHDSSPADQHYYQLQKIASLLRLASNHSADKNFAAMPRSFWLQRQCQAQSRERTNTAIGSVSAAATMATGVWMSHERNDTSGALSEQFG
jgi:hypothetical protein